MSDKTVTTTTKSDFERGAEAMRDSIVRRIEQDGMPITWKFQAFDIAKQTGVPHDWGN